jgi:hypothetical protein
MEATYNLRNGIDWRFTLLIVCLEPEHKRCKWLGSKGLHREDKGEQKCFPACQEAEERFDGVRLAFRLATSFCHPLLGDLNVLKHTCQLVSGIILLSSRTYTFGKDPVWFGGSWRVG